MIFIALAISDNAKAAALRLKPCNVIADTSVSAAIREQLFNPSTGLYYPLSVKHYYQRRGYKLIWIMPDTIYTHAWDAMMLLDCVVQYGSIHADYHPAELLYDKLHAMTTARNKVSSKEKAAFDIMLTDAMITLINNLHFGKLNPGCNASQIDGGSIGGFAAEVVLNNALQQPHFIHTIELAQPAFKQYADLQYHRHLLTGLYTGDCYEIPVKDVRKMAINLERLRWNSGNEKIYIDINIPAFTLKLHMADSDYLFKVIVGKPSAQPGVDKYHRFFYYITWVECNLKKNLFPVL